jgi:predicted AAA+ superfamily ATPase
MLDDVSIIPRHLSTEVYKALAYSRVVNIIGPRQSGKTTLVRDILNVGKFITLDHQNTLSAIEEDPSGQLESLMSELTDTPLIIDEVQRSKKLPLAIKMLVDADRRKGQFILTGSSNIFTSSAVADSLAGRMLTFKLWPLTLAETKLRPPSKLLDRAVTNSLNLTSLPRAEPLTRADYIDLILRGGYPEIREYPLAPRQVAYRNYVDAVVDRDVADLLRIRKSDALRRLIDQLAIRTGLELNMTELCKSIGVQRNTVDQYLDVLLKLSLVIRLGAWTSGETGREIKNSKNHFVDTGIAAALRNLKPESFNADANPAALGGLVENFVLSELIRSTPFQENSFRFYHWRDQRGHEIDILAESANHLVAIEVKASSSVNAEDFRHLNWFRNTGPGKRRNVTSIVFYLGGRKLTFGERRYALPVSCLW